MPSSLQAQMTRTAISPRLAMRTLLNRADGKQSLPVLHWLSVHYELALHDSGSLRLDFVHELHGLYDAKHLTWLYTFADANKWRRAGRRAFIERAHDGRLDEDQAGVGGLFGFRFN